jgi:hypothetical protein
MTDDNVVERPADPDSGDRGGANDLPSDQELARLRAAEEFAWAFAIAVGTGMFNVPEAERKFVSPTFLDWCDLAVQTGIMNPGSQNPLDTADESE